MLFGETVAVYCENRTKRIYTMCVCRMQSFGVLEQVARILTTRL
jgi:hypothetical protein